MTELSESVRKITTILLAIFLWLHALFFLNVQTTLVSTASRVLRLNSSEIIIFILLVVFSFVVGSGFWKSLRSLAYIYALRYAIVPHRQCHNYGNSFMIFFDICASRANCDPANEGHRKTGQRTSPNWISYLSAHSFI
jgi:hypothetical protein